MPGPAALWVAEGRCRAEGGGGILAGNDVIRPTKSVSPTTGANGVIQTYTYTIDLEQVSLDNSQGLDAIYDILPIDFPGSPTIAGTCLSANGLPPCDFSGAPLIESIAGQARLRWPDTGTFANTNPGDIGYFEPGQTKKLTFQVVNGDLGSAGNNEVHCNWVVLKPWDTVSGPVAPITIAPP